MKRWNLFLPDELIEKVKFLAAKQGISAAEFVRIAVEKAAKTPPLTPSERGETQAERGVTPRNDT